MPLLPLLFLSHFASHLFPHIQLAPVISLTHPQSLFLYPHTPTFHSHPSLLHSTSALYFFPNPSPRCYNIWQSKIFLNLPFVLMLTPHFPTLQLYLFDNRAPSLKKKGIVSPSLIPLVSLLSTHFSTPTDCHSRSLSVPHSQSSSRPPPIPSISTIFNKIHPSLLPGQKRTAVCRPALISPPFLRCVSQLLSMPWPS